MLFRHGEIVRPPTSDFDRALLSEEGERQVRAIADRWPFEPPAAIYASPLWRSVQSALPLSERFGRTVRIRECLTEWSPTRGDLDQDVYLEMEARCWQDVDHVPESGESLRAAQRRIVDCLRGISVAHPGETVTVSGHGTLMSLFAVHVRDERPSNEYKRTIGFGDVGLVEYANGGFEIRREFDPLN